MRTNIAFAFTFAFSAVAAASGGATYGPAPITLKGYDGGKLTLSRTQARLLGMCYTIV
jgi:hypothetical protein